MNCHFYPHPERPQRAARGGRSASPAASPARYQPPATQGTVVEHERKSRHQPFGLLEVLARFP